MVRFNTVTVDQAASTVAVGAGLLWDDVYKALDGTGLNVVGSRVPGIGVAGFTLGGGQYFSSQDNGYSSVYKGYSWKTSQFGLTIDNIDSYELVLPDSDVLNRGRCRSSPDIRGKELSSLFVITPAEPKNAPEEPAHACSRPTA